MIYRAPTQRPTPPPLEGTDMASPAPATLSDKLAVIQLNATRLAQAARANPAVLGPVHEDITEMYLLSIGAAEYVDQQTEQAATLAAGAVAS